VKRASKVDKEFDLPIKPGSSLMAYWKAGAFEGVVLSGAMSVGLALLSAAGAALTLF